MLEVLIVAAVTSVIKKINANDTTPLIQERPGYLRTAIKGCRSLALEAMEAGDLELAKCYIKAAYKYGYKIGEALTQEQIDLERQFQKLLIKRHHELALDVKELGDQGKYYQMVEVIHNYEMHLKHVPGFRGILGK